MLRNFISLILCLGEILANSTQDDFEIENRIVGGHRCSVADHKYMIAILFTDSYIFICGGSLLSAKWVLTARHCIINVKDPRTYTAVAGVEVPDEEYWGEDMQISVAIGCYIHPQSDIGLMNLKKPIKANRLVAYVTLSTYLNIVDIKLEEICSNCTVLGWGSQNAIKVDETLINNKEVITYDPYLQCLNFSVISPDECYERLKPITKFNTSGSLFCAFKKNTDACLGDSGGPLMCNGIQYGITSSGYGCAYNDFPGLYVKVHYFENFIKDVIDKAKSEIPERCSVIEFSFLVAIIHQINKNNFKYLYAGSMLTESWVLTSGHCMSNCKTPNYYTVVAGLKDPFKFDPSDKNIMSRQVAKCFQSPTRNKTQDLALMKLKNKFNSVETISYMRCATSMDEKLSKFEKVCNNGMLFGYGRPKNASMRNLQCDRTTVPSEQDCKEIWPPDIIGNQYGCINELRTGNCYPTLGAPLICDGIQYGVLASVACKVAAPILITKVSEYDTFLKKTVYLTDGNLPDLWKANDGLNNLVNLYIFTFSFVLFLI